LNLAEEIESLFLIKGYQWKIDGELKSPTAADISDVFERAKEMLSVGDSIEIGRLIINKYDEDKYDIYVQIGEL
jgi:hypothetical protein